MLFSTFIKCLSGAHIEINNAGHRSNNQRKQDSDTSQNQSQKEEGITDNTSINASVYETIDKI